MAAWLACRLIIGETRPRPHLVGMLKSPLVSLSDMPSRTMPINTKKGCVYLIQAGDMHRFKIGCAADPKRRLRELQTSSPVRLRMIGWKQCNNMMAEERKWHELFKGVRKVGEWFDLSHNQIWKIARRLKADLEIHFSKRTVPNLEVGKHYFVSFGSGKVIEVELLEIPDADGHPTVSVRNLKQGHIHSLYPDEIRASPIDAIFNCVTW